MITRSETENWTKSKSQILNGGRHVGWILMGPHLLSYVSQRRHCILSTCLILMIIVWIPHVIFYYLPNRCCNNHRVYLYSLCYFEYTPSSHPLISATSASLLLLFYFLSPLCLCLSLPAALCLFMAHSVFLFRCLTLSGLMQKKIKKNKKKLLCRSEQADLQGH